MSTTTIGTFIHKGGQLLDICATSDEIIIGHYASDAIVTDEGGDEFYIDHIGDAIFRTDVVITTAKGDIHMKLGVEGDMEVKPDGSHFWAAF